MRIAAFCLLSVGLVATAANGQNITVKANTNKIATVKAGGMTIDTYKSVPDGTYSMPAGSNVPQWDVRTERGTVDANGNFASENPADLPSNDTAGGAAQNSIAFSNIAPLAAKWGVAGYHYSWTLNDPIPPSAPTKYVRAQLRKPNVFWMMTPQAAALTPLW